ncbi:hypothetical protein [Dyadobacter sp. NIV53]|uniref:hypothetical protein n=1 Tax=Dyadobacter sp. NIV53 TaxID=2861765 RepID=UPI001C8808FF|nr:hypothetical protein [Dyadobacter sp. NIV53]
MKFKVILFFAAAISLASCVDIPDFSDTPKIYYNGISQHTEIDTITSPGNEQKVEIVTITIDFEDGDGDLGASEEERNDVNFREAYTKVPNWGLPANYELITMTKQRDSSWTERIIPLDSSKFFKILKTDGKPGPIKGKLDLFVRFPDSRSTVKTTQKYKVRIIDRAFHISNQIEPTDEVIVPILQ